MNQRLWKAHVEAVELRRQIRELERKFRDVTRTRPTWCVYCGTPTASKRRVCHAHTDLPALDAGYHA